MDSRPDPRRRDQPTGLQAVPSSRSRGCTTSWETHPHSDRAGLRLGCRAASSGPRLCFPHPAQPFARTPGIRSSPFAAVERSGWRLGAPPPKHCHGGLLFARPRPGSYDNRGNHCDASTRSPRAPARHSRMRIGRAAPRPAASSQAASPLKDGGRCAPGALLLQAWQRLHPGTESGRVGEATSGGVPRCHPQESRLENILEPISIRGGGASWRLLGSCHDPPSDPILDPYGGE